MWTKIFTKKRLIGWGSAIVFIIGGVATQMDTASFKEAVCGAPVIENK